MSHTTVILEGPMGKALGREWKFLNVRSARQALAMVEANTGKAFAWVRDNLQKYANYRVLLEYADGRKGELDTNSYTDMTQRGVKTVRFVPVTEGASAVLRVVVGVAIMYVGWGTPWAVSIGASIALGGVSELLSPKPKMGTSSPSEENKKSHYFNGATNMSNQGAPVQLVYGRCKVGSQAISAAMTVDQLL